MAFLSQIGGMIGKGAMTAGKAAGGMAIQQAANRMQQTPLGNFMTPMGQGQQPQQSPSDFWNNFATYMNGRFGSRKQQAQQPTQMPSLAKYFRSY